MGGRDNSRWLYSDMANVVSVARSSAKAATPILLAGASEAAATVSAPASSDITTDAVTGLPRCPAFLSECARVQAETRLGRQAWAGILIGVDHFQAINDSLGYEAGSGYLRCITDALLSQADAHAVSSTALDEFCLLVKAADAEAATRAAETIYAMLPRTCAMSMAGGPPVTCSIGVALIDPNVTSEVVLRRLVHASAAARTAGGNRVVTYSPQDKRIQRSARSSAVVLEIQDMLAQGRIALDLQEVRPIAAPESGQPHFEVLARFIDKDGARMAPAPFIEAAEQHRLVQRIDRYVLEEACRVLGLLQARGARLPRLSVNLSGATLANSDLFDRIQEVLTKHRVPVEAIGFEITESAAIRGIDEARDTLARLREIGCHISLDDFGVGASSFGYLKDLPLSCVKVDGRFIRGMLSDKTDCLIVEGLQRAAASLCLETTAEWVENEQALRAVRELGFTSVQGYHIHKPEPIEKVLGL